MGIPILQRANGNHLWPQAGAPQDAGVPQEADINPSSFTGSVDIDDLDLSPNPGSQKVIEGGGEGSAIALDPRVEITGEEAPGEILHLELLGAELTPAPRQAPALTSKAPTWCRSSEHPAPTHPSPTRFPTQQNAFFDVSRQGNLPLRLLVARIPRTIVCSVERNPYQSSSTSVGQPAGVLINTCEVRQYQMYAQMRKSPHRRRDRRECLPLEPPRSDPCNPKVCGGLHHGPRFCCGFVLHEQLYRKVDMPVCRAGAGVWVVWNTPQRPRNVPRGEG